MKRGSHYSTLETNAKVPYLGGDLHRDTEAKLEQWMGSVLPMLQIRDCVPILNNVIYVNLACEAMMLFWQRQ